MSEPLLIALNKPFGVLCQFTDTEDRSTLADLIDQPGVYPAGRLDRDSEGLLLLTDDGQLQQRISAPGAGLWKTYLLQVEGRPTATQLKRLRDGVELNDGRTRPARARLLAKRPGWLWSRDPPVRVRRKIPTSWLQLALREGRNRQVRRMTAAVGLPTLRLVRSAIGGCELADLAPGDWKVVAPDAPYRGDSK